jgi:predicted Zn-dependent protease with MMP-like domain
MATAPSSTTRSCLRWRSGRSASCRTARALLRDVPIIVAELPAEADVETGLDPRALGLFTGTAYPDMPHVGGQPGLTQIVLFRRNIERVADDEDDLREELRITLLHETGHFFGLDEEALEGTALE